MPTSVTEVRERLLRRKKVSPIPASDFLSSGSTMLNLATTGRVNGCFTRGRYFWLVGDSTSGKTFLAMTCLAEAAINPNFDKYRFIFDDAEDGALMDKTAFFGSKVTERIEPPAGTKKDPKFSATVQELYANLNTALKAGKPFIYILDSMDGISDDDEIDKARQKERAAAKGKEDEVKGSYGMAKAKLNKQRIRQLRPLLMRSGSILIIISQTTTNIGFGSKFEPKKASGGLALKFFATLEIWSSVRGHIKKSVRGKDRELGIIAKVQVKKNRITGRDRTVEIPILHSHGIDDIGSMVRFLVEEKHWDQAKDSGPIEATEFRASLREEALVQHIEKNDLEMELQAIVAKVWDEIETELSAKRKHKYAEE